MKVKLSLFLLVSCMLQSTIAQEILPILKATQKNIDIRDGKKLNLQSWTISPEINPDVYETASLDQNVTFITDQDSLTVKIKKDTEFNFVILLNDSIKAYTQIKYRMPNLEKLKNAALYHFKQDRLIPKFSYQAMENPNLVKIRQSLKLDSIAGSGNETSRILNIMHWVHNTVKHDGSSNNPTQKNTLALLQTCKTENRGLNCRMMAMILNECYLAMGIKSRYVSCMPKETQFSDSHVINMVYSTDLKKWLWIDPTFNAYVKDEKGKLLSIAEVRERLVLGKTLVLNPDANWNNKNPQTKEYYLDVYMAKNLYRLKSPLVSEYDNETWKEGKVITYVELLPLDGLEQTPLVHQQTDSLTGTTFINYKTNNPTLFWTTPTQKQPKL